MSSRWRDGARAVLLLFVLLLPAACQPVPQPFRSEDPAAEQPLSAPGAQAGVLVAAPEGVPGGAAFAEAVAEALARREVLAFTGTSNRASWRLTARAEAVPVAGAEGRTRLTLHWRLADAAGEARGAHDQQADVAARAWRAGDAALTARLAEEAALSLAPLFTDANAPGAAPRHLTVHEVVGATGDGNVSLRRAVAYALERRGFSVSDEVAAEAIVITGTVRVRPNGAAGDDVTVTWTALAPDGAVLGTVAQANRVPSGSLAGAWGIAAMQVAEAAAPGIARLIARAGGGNEARDRAR